MKKYGKVLLGSCLAWGMAVCHAADMSVQLTTSDGSTKFSIQNSGAGEVASIDSQGNATFAKVTQTGTGGTFILNQSTLQPGSTLFVSSGTVNNLTVGTSLGLPAGSVADGALAAGTLPSTVIASSIAVNAVYPGAVSAGTYAAITGVGTQAQALNMNSNAINNLAAPSAGTDAANMSYVDTKAGGTNVILNQNTLQAGSTLDVASGTVNLFNIGTMGTLAGKYRLGAIEGLPWAGNFLFQFSSATVNGTLSITFNNVGLKSYSAAPFVIVSPVYTLSGTADLACHANSITATGMTIQCILTTEGGLGLVTVAQDTTNREVDYLLMGVAP